MTSLIYQWIDLVWLPIIFFASHKQHRLIAVGFFAACAFMMRLSVEFFGEIGYPNGVFGLIDMSLYERNLFAYSAIYGIYVLLAHYSPGSRSVVFMAGSISIFFFALMVSMGVMVL